MANFNWTFVNVDGVVNVSAISASSYVSASTFHGDGSGLTGVTGEWDGTLTGNAIITGNLSASLGLTGSSLRTATTIIDSTHVSSSLNISGAAFYGDGSTLSGISAGAITTYNTSGDNRVITSVDSSTVQGEASLTFDGSKLSAVGQISASLGVTGSSVRTLNTVIDATHVSSSLNLSASAFYGDGSTLSGIINSYANSGNNRIITSVDAASINAEANLTFDGNDLLVASSTASRPRFFITNQNADENPSQIIFNKTSSSPAENDTIGRMVFQSYDSAGNPTVYGQIEGDIKKPNSGAERGRIKLTVAEFDGTLTEGLTIQGSNADGKVDISVPNGSLSLTDNNKLYFGNAFDASIEYDEAVSDKLIISGAHGGIYVSGSGGLTVAVNDGLTVTSATNDNPIITVENNSDGVGGGQLNFVRTTTDEAANDIIGSVNFMAKDSAGNDHIYAAIQGLIDDPTSGGEEGRLIFNVAEFDGNQQEGFRIEGQAVNGIVNVIASNGSIQMKDLGTAGTTPASGFGGLYVNGDNLYFINDSGTSAQLNAGGGASTAYNSFTANYTVTTDHDIMGIITTGSAITASLASAATYAAGQKFIFKDVSGSCSGSNHIVISASQNHVGQNIDGQGILKIQSGYGSITLASDGVASFYIIGTN